MRYFFLISIFCLSLLAVSAQEANERYATVGLTANQYQILVTDTTHGLAIDHFHKNEDGLLEFVFSETELRQLDSRGLAYTTIIADYQAHFDSLVSQDLRPRSSSACGLANFDTGNMGGYHTYDEMVEHIMTMRDQYPDLVAIEEIGRSIEDRPIYAIKISDNPSIDESATEGIVYYEAITHAREPMSLEATLYYMWWLLENSDADQEVVYLLANREIYFVPIVNPDGYVYNEETNPNGGGLWRKNRRDVDGTCFGVDLNRNYTEGYGLNSGSSSNACSQTYRGTEALSEPESQAVAAFVDRIRPAVAFSSHTFGDKFLSPWGYTNGLPDFDLYAEFASEFMPKQYDGYGTTATMLGYTSSGTTRDHMHVHGTLTWTPEIGHSFWESPAVICDRVEEFRKAMLYLTWVAGDYACLHDFTVAEDQVRSGATASLDFRIKNRGLSMPAEDVSVVISTQEASVTVTNAAANLGTITHRSFGATAGAPITVAVNEAAQPGDRLAIDVSVLQGADTSYRKTIYLFVGEQETYYSTDFEVDPKWDSPNSLWDTCSLDAVSGAYSFADSRLGNYPANTFALVMMPESINLSQAAMPFATFNAKWSLEVDQDYVSILGSTDGVNWRPLQGRYTDFLGRYTANSHWVQEQVDLSDYIGEPNFYVGFRIESDATVHSDGFYVDDFRVADFRESTISDVDDASNVLKSSIKVSPNPASDYLLITSDAPIEEILLYGLDGQLVQQQYFEASQEHREDVSLLRSGFYILSVRRIDGVVSTSKVIIR